MKVYNQPDPQLWPDLLARPTLDTQNLETQVTQMLDRIQQQGEPALVEFTQKFDGVELQNFRVSAGEFETAEQLVSADLKNAIEQAAQNIERFHAAQREMPQVIETMPGVRCWRRSVGIEKVGLYIPGGTAPLFSTVLMLGIPAKLAGCKEVVLCSPPRQDGTIDPVILFTARLVGISQVFKLGGVQAIGAMAYGKGGLPAVQKIFGPGNQYVTAAKQIVSRQGVAIDMPAGPSEVMVVADDTAVPEFVAADLLSQAEHGSDSQVVLVAFSMAFVERVQAALELQLGELTRIKLALAALDNSVAMVVDARDAALELVNAYAPEHLILAIRNAEPFGNQVRNAGSVFLGNYTPESAGDYALGTNHTLPTNGFARAYSGVSLDSFVKKITYQQISEAGLQRLGPVVEKMAIAEDLDGHAKAVTIRLEQLASDRTEAIQKEIVEIPIVPRINYLLRENIRDLQPYRSARSEFTGSAEVFLDANENPYASTLNRYPDPLQKELKTAIGQLKGVTPEQIFLGNGSDEAIDLLIRMFCEPRQDEIMILPPTYGMYQVCAMTSDVGIKRVPLNAQFQPEVDSIVGLSGATAKILFLCNPNNPTGTTIPTKTLERIIRDFPGIVVVDEAYIDFAEDQTCLRLLDSYENLVVLQTFSKAWGLAGARLGMAFAHPFLIKVLNQVKPPYNINQLSQRAALDALQRLNVMEQQRSETLQQRQLLTKVLSTFDFVKEVVPSQTNFLLVRVSRPQQLYRFLLKRSLIVRDRSRQPRCEGGLRITVGTPFENKRLLQALTQYQASALSSNPTILTQQK